MKEERYPPKTFNTEKRKTDAYGTAGTLWGDY